MASKFQNEAVDCSSIFDFLGVPFFAGFCFFFAMILSVSRDGVPTERQRLLFANENRIMRFGGDTVGVGDNT